MDYGYEPPRPPRRRRRLGFSTRTNIIVVLAAFVICVALIKLADRPMPFDPTEPASQTSVQPHQH